MDYWLYRVGSFIHTRPPQRLAVWSETWLSTSPEASAPATVGHLNPRAQDTQKYFGFTSPLRYWTTTTFIERLWPVPRWRFSTHFGQTHFTGIFNTNAPEAAFRLQRVGAGGALGRVCPPILSDAAFVDVPRRRLIDHSAFALRLAIYGGALPLSFVDPTSGRSYQNVVFHRKTETWDNVVAYRLMPNPIRIWRRWRNWDENKDLAHLGWVPHERHDFGT